MEITHNTIIANTLEIGLNQNPKDLNDSVLYDNYPEFIKKYSKTFLVCRSSFEHSEQLKNLWQKFKYDISTNYKSYIYGIWLFNIWNLCMPMVIATEKLNNYKYRFMLSKYNLYYFTSDVYSNQYSYDGSINLVKTDKSNDTLVFIKSNNNNLERTSTTTNNGITTKINKYYTKYKGNYIVLHRMWDGGRDSWDELYLLLFEDITSNKPLSKYKIKYIKSPKPPITQQHHFYQRAYGAFKPTNKGDIFGHPFSLDKDDVKNNTYEFNKIFNNILRDDALLYYYEYIMDKCFQKSYHDFLNLKIKKNKLYKYFDTPDNKLALKNLIDTKFKTYLVEFLKTNPIEYLGNHYITFYEIEFLECNIPNLTQWIIAEKYRTPCVDICDCIVACMGKEESGYVHKKKKHIILEKDEQFGINLGVVSRDNYLFCDPDGLGRRKEFGLIVRSVCPTGLAINSGLNIGDIITHVNGRYLKGMSYNQVVNWVKTLTYMELIVYPKDIKPKDIKPKEHETTTKSSMCCVCYDKEITHSFIPCGHKCICANCSKLQEWNTCPYCNMPTSSRYPIKIYEISAT